MSLYRFVYNRQQANCFSQADTLYYERAQLGWRSARPGGLTLGTGRREGGRRASVPETGPLYVQRGPWLFVPQREQRVHLRCPPRRYPAGHQGDHNQQQRKPHKRQRIGRAYTEQQTLHKSRES